MRDNNDNKDLYCLQVLQRYDNQAIYCESPINKKITYIHGNPWPFYKTGLIYDDYIM